MSHSKHRTMSPRTREAMLSGLVEQLQLPVTDLALYDRAFTHSSYANEQRKFNVSHNERLEFLGDAVLDLIVGEYLFKRYPQMTEGELTKHKSAVVCENSLASLSRRLQFGNYLLLGKGEHIGGGRERASILADTFEAFVGATYLATNYEVTSQFVLSHLDEYIQKAIEGQLEKDYKTRLQEIVQRDGVDHHLQYVLVSAVGPDHSKVFTVQVRINHKNYGKGTGRSKKEAEQHSARETIAMLAEHPKF